MQDGLLTQALPYLLDDLAVVGAQGCLYLLALVPTGQDELGIYDSVGRQFG